MPKTWQAWHFGEGRNRMRGGQKPNAWSISRDRRSTVALSLAKKLFDIKPSMYTWQAWHCGEGWNWTRWGQNRRRGPFLVAGAWLWHLQRNGSISLPSIYYTWQAWHCGEGRSKQKAWSISRGRRCTFPRYPLVFSCVALPLAKKWLDIPSDVGVALWRGSKPTAGGNAWSISCGRRSAFDDVLWCFCCVSLSLAKTWRSDVYTAQVLGVLKFSEGTKVVQLKSLPTMAATQNEIKVAPTCLQNLSKLAF